MKGKRIGLQNSLSRCQFMGDKLSLVWEIAKRMPKARISRANIAVTFRCNQKCLMCNIWKYNNEQEKDKELDSAEVYKIIRRNDLMWISLTGGEPFLNENIINILTLVMLNCNLVSIVSNGSMPEYIAETVRDSLRRPNGIFVFSISLEGDESTHDNITGTRGSYKKAVKTIEKLKSINSDNLHIGVEHLLSNRTDGSLKHVRELAEYYEVGLTYTREQLSPYYHNVNGAKPAQINYPPISYSVNPFDVMHNLFLLGMKKQNRKLCEAGKYSVFIDPYANLYPCLPQAPENPIMDLRETDYVIGNIKKESEELYKKCKSPCYTPCEVYASMMFRPWRLL